MDSDLNRKRKATLLAQRATLTAIAGLLEYLRMMHPPRDEEQRRLLDRLEDHLVKVVDTFDQLTQD